MERHTTRIQPWLRMYGAVSYGRMKHKAGGSHQHETSVTSVMAEVGVVIVKENCDSLTPVFSMRNQVLQVALPGVSAHMRKE